MIIFAAQLLTIGHSCSTAAGASAAAAGANSPAEATPVAASVAYTARTMSGSTLLEDALPLVQLPSIAAENARQVLQQLGFRNALDLQLLGGGPEADAVMAALEEEGVGLSIGSRAKVRLLIGDGAHLDRFLPGGRCGAVEGSEVVASRAPDEAYAPSPHARQTSRLLQESATGSQEPKTRGMSTDTIAIVLSVLVGAAGYLVQAYTARRAEFAAAEQSQQQQFAEQTRQREHQVLLAQIQRTDRWIDDCCGPVEAALAHVQWARRYFVADMVFELESNDPDAVAEMLAATASFIPISDDGIVRSRRSGEVSWEPWDSTVLTNTFAQYTKADLSAAALSIAATHDFIVFSQPYVS